MTLLAILMTAATCDSVRPAASASSVVIRADSSQFSIAIIPDTQTEVTRESDGRFVNRTAWLAANRSNLNLKYVIHTGDMMNWDTTDHEQYVRGSAAMAKLDAASIPWTAAIGNHDTGAVCAGGSACPGQSARVNVRNTSTYNSYFPLSRFPGIRGVFESGKVDNAWSTFTAGDENWLVLTLELWPRTEVVSWAASVVASHPTYNVIIATHSYLGADGSIEQGNGGYGATSPQYLFDQVVKPYSNVKFVFSGHVGEATNRVDYRPDGSKVVSILGAFHSPTTNPLQILTIDTAAGTASTRFLAPLDGTSWPQYSVSVGGLTWASGRVPANPTIALRSVANDRYVVAEAAGTWPLIANRAWVADWESFTLQRLSGNDVALVAHADGSYVCAEAAGAMALIANRGSIGPWETFELINNADGTVSLRSRANNLIVTAESAGSLPLVANRPFIDKWEKFILEYH